MKKIQFTDWNTVLFNGKEMELSKFFSMIDQNIENCDYNVYYDEEDVEFKICFNGEDYKVILSEKAKKDLKKGVLNPITKHLLSLSRIQKMVDVSNNDKGIAVSEILDDDAKKVYLEKLKSNKFSLKKYFLDYGKDLYQSKEYVKNKLYDQLDGDAIAGFGLGMLGAIAAIVFVTLTENYIHFLWMFTGIAINIAKYTGYFIYNQVKNRVQRLVQNINNNRLRKTKIKCLEKSFESNNILNEENINNKVISNQDVKSIIPVMINKLIELLKSVSPENRGTLTSEIREFLLDYQKMISDSSKTDRELFLENKSICERIVDLELRINAAKRLNNNRNYEADYLLGKLDELEEDSHEFESQKIYCKIR